MKSDVRREESVEAVADELTRPSVLPEPEFDAGSLGDLPTGPGCYLMRNVKGVVIYVGKAVNLRNRVKNYFSKSGDGRLMIEFLRRHIARVETIVTATEKEALVLENTLIKEHQPRYNVRLRDDKTYISLRMRMDHAFPRLETVRIRRASQLRRNDKDLYFGPFVAGYEVKLTTQFLLRVFPVRTCKDSVFANRARPCLLYDVGKCCGACAVPVGGAEYGELVQSVARFFRGNTHEVRTLLTERMMELARREQFERAALIRDRLRAMDDALERQGAVTHERFSRDVIGVFSQGGRSGVVIMQYRDGTLMGKSEYFLRNLDMPDAALLSTVLSQHYDLDVPPPMIMVATAPMDEAVLTEWLRERRSGGAFALVVPQRGDKRKQLESAELNAKMLHERRVAKEQSESEQLQIVGQYLELSAAPNTIECVDISALMGTHAVGSVVRFAGGLPDKNSYRLYKIRTVQESNDYAMMHEVLTRRFRPSGTTVAVEPPDLLLVDGGRGQLNIALQVLGELGVTGVALAGIAKTPVDGHAMRSAGGRAANRADERIFLPGRKNPVVFQPNSPGLFLLQRVRDEAHRTAIAFHKKLRAKKAHHSELDDVPGIGPARRKALLRRFGSVTALRFASLEQIAEVDGMGPALAQTVIDCLVGQGAGA